MPKRQNRPTDPVPQDLEAALDDLGIEVGRSDDDEIWGLCPNPKHIDHRANNWSMNRESGWHSCFACGYSGSLLQLAIDLKFRDDGGAWEASSWIRSFEFDLRVLDEVQQYDDKAPRRRHREEAAPVSEARLALFDPPPAEQLALRRLTKDAAAAYGILWHDKTASWILPIRDPAGKLMGWQRKTGKKVRNYPQFMEKQTTLFGLHLVEAGRDVVFSESPLDAARFLSAGIDTVGVATMGVRIADVQMRLLHTRSDGRLVEALDNDIEGDRARLRLLDGWAMRTHMFHLNYDVTEGKDPGEMDDDELRDAYRTMRGSLELHIGDAGGA